MGRNLGYQGVLDTDPIFNLVSTVVKTQLGLACLNLHLRIDSSQIYQGLLNYNLLTFSLQSKNVSEYDQEIPHYHKRASKQHQKVEP